MGGSCRGFEESDLGSDLLWLRFPGRRVGGWVPTNWGCLKSEEEPMFRMPSFSSFDDGPSFLRLKALEVQRRWDRG